jgi:hypothetical protein
MSLFAKCCPITINVFRRKKKTKDDEKEDSPAAPTPWAPEYARFRNMLESHKRYIVLTKKKDSRGLSADETAEMTALRCLVSVKFLEDASTRQKVIVRNLKHDLEFVDKDITILKEKRPSLTGAALKKLDKDTITLYRKKAGIEATLVKESADLELLHQHVASWPKLCRLPPTA